MIENLTRDQFADNLNTDFKMFFADDVSADVKLVEVTELSRRPRNESFSLIFLAPVDAPVLNQMFRMEHPSLGSFELFMGPVSQNESGIRYEAVFNRLTD